VNNNLSDIIYDLLQHHECVVLPGIGAFISSIKHGYHDEKSGLIHPPTYQLSFNHKVTRNDGLLLQAISIDTKCSILEASEKLKAWRKEIESNLEIHKRLEFGMLGVLLLDANQVIRFVFTTQTISSGIYFGLKPIALRRLPAELKIDLPNPIFDNSIAEIEVIPISKRKPNTSWRRWAAAAAILLPIGFYSWYLPTQTGVLQSGHITIQDFIPFSSIPNEISVYKQRQNSNKLWVDENPSEADANTDAIQLEMLPDVTLDYTLEKSTDFTESNQFSNSGYFIVTGCFREEANATKFLEKMSADGIQGQLIDVQGGLYRVGVGGFSDQEGAATMVKELKYKGFDSWLLKK
jgi:hypothetical protein